MKAWRIHIQILKGRLADIGMFIGSDVPRPGQETARYSGEDTPLQLVQPEPTQRHFGGERLTILQSASQQGSAGL